MIGYRGVGIRQGEEEWKAYINAALEKVRADGVIADWVEEFEEPDLVEARIELWDPSKVPAED